MIIDVEDKVETLLEHLDDYLNVVRNEDDSVESAMDRIHKRQILKDYLIELFEFKLKRM